MYYASASQGLVREIGVPRETPNWTWPDTAAARALRTPARARPMLPN